MFKAFILLNKPNCLFINCGLLSFPNKKFKPSASANILAITIDGKATLHS